MGSTSEPAVEAARAGESGMGFAVVAEEVRNLAQRCAQAARDTAGMIEESISRSRDGKLKVEQVAHSVKAVSAEFLTVKKLLDEINGASQQQSRGIDLINSSVTRMDQITQSTAATAEESASAAEELNAQSESLKEAVDRLTALVGQS